MKKKSSFIQTNLSGSSNSITSLIPKKRHILTEKEKDIRREKDEAHIAWKLLKSRKFGANISDRQKFLLEKYYGIRPQEIS
mgnify:CR=1 FL=1